jgi:hypothetical protein
MYVTSAIRSHCCGAICHPNNAVPATPVRHFRGNNRCNELTRALVRHIVTKMVTQQCCSAAVLQPTVSPPRRMVSSRWTGRLHRPLLCGVWSVQA